MAHGEHESTTARGDIGAERAAHSEVIGLWVDDAHPDALPGSIGREKATWRMTVSFEGCRAFARSKIHPATVALAAWAVVLARHGGSDDVLFTAQLQAASDWPLPIRVRVDSKSSVSAWLERFERRLRIAEARGPIPPGVAAELVDAVGGCGDTAFFFVHDRQLAEARLRAERCRCPVRVFARPDTSTIQIEYASRLFRPGDISALARHLDVVIQAMAADPGRAVGALQVLTADEERLLLHEWNATATSFPASACIHELFEQQVARTPDAVAVVCGDRRWTYAQLNARAEAVAARLRVAGLQTAALAAVSLNRSPELVMALLAVLKAGGAFVPLDSHSAPERLQTMLHHARPHVVLVSGETEQSLPTGEYSVLRVDDVDFEGRLAPPDGVESTNPAYVVYTPRPKGTPKGVVVTHRSVANLFTAMDALIGRDPGVWLALSSVDSDMLVLDVLWTLSRGFRVILEEDDESKPHQAPASSLARLVRRHGVTHMQVKPALASLLADAEGMTALRQLRRLMIGREPLAPGLAQRLARRVSPEGRVFNLYGTTETTVWSTAHAIESHDGDAPIGRPLANSRVYVLDTSRRLVPVGRPGELYIGGEGVAEGYLNNPELTRDTFIVNPFSWNASDRLYRTGDIVRQDATGRLHFLRRRDG